MLINTDSVGRNGARDLTLVQLKAWHVKARHVTLAVTAVFGLDLR